MLSADDRFSDQYKFYLGMQNVAFLTGFLRFPKGAGIESKMFYIQQNSYTNHMIPIHLRDHDRLPVDCATEYLPVKVTCRVLGQVDPATGERMVYLSALSIKGANILDMPPNEAFLKPVPEGVPSEEFKPKDYGLPSKMSGTSNQVFVAGFVGSTHIEASHKEGDSRRTLVIMLQQHEKADRALHVRYKDKFTDKVKELLKPGVPLAVQGRITIKVKPVGEPDGDGKYASNLLIPYIELTDKPLIATPQTIREYPEWARLLNQQTKGVRKENTPGASAPGEVRQGGTATKDETPADELDMDSIS